MLVSGVVLNLEVQKGVIQLVEGCCSSTVTGASAAEFRTHENLGAAVRLGFIRELREYS